MQEIPRFLPQMIPAPVCRVVFLIAMMSTYPVYGDGHPSHSQSNLQKPTTRQYNDRLPPVMPGEEIVTETGQKMKTWSSSGPVPVIQRNPQQPVGVGSGAAGVGIIVDERYRFGDRPSPHGDPATQPATPRRR